MDSGALRHKVALLKPTEKVDRYGKSGITYEQSAIVRAMIVPVSMSEQTERNKLQATTDYTVMIRYYGALNETWRVLWIATGKSFEISSVLPDPTATRTMTLKCSEVK